MAFIPFPLAEWMLKYLTNIDLVTKKIIIIVHDMDIISSSPLTVGLVLYLTKGAASICLFILLYAINLINNIQCTLYISCKENLGSYGMSYLVQKLEPGYRHSAYYLLQKVVWYQ